MKSLLKPLFRRPLLAVLLSLPVHAGQAPVVAIKADASGRLTLMRNGAPFVIHGAGGTGHLKDLVKYGGNSIRTWGIESLAEKVEGKPLLDYCQDLGIAVTAGIWIGHERHGFDYADAAQVKKQRDTVRAAVRRYRSHPALLMWGLGNEMEGPTADGKDPRIAENTDICLGSYVFLWGQKQEVTATWYGMFLASGEKLPTVDAVCYAWSGK